MKHTLICILTMFALLSLSACTSVPAGSMPPGTITELAVGTVTDAAILVVEKNPKAKPVLQAISTRLDEILQGRDVTQAGVDLFIQQLDIGANLTPEQRKVMSRAVSRTFTLLTVLTGSSVLNLAEPSPGMPSDQADKVRQARAIVQQIKASVDAVLL